MDYNMYETWFMDERYKYVGNMNMIPTHCIIDPDVYNKIVKIIKNKATQFKIDSNDIIYLGTKIKPGYGHGSDVFNFYVVEE